MTPTLINVKVSGIIRRGKRKKNVFIVAKIEIVPIEIKVCLEGILCTLKFCQQRNEHQFNDKNTHRN